MQIKLLFLIVPLFLLGCVEGAQTSVGVGPNPAVDVDDSGIAVEGVSSNEPE